jgi:hypothetical protein
MGQKGLERLPRVRIVIDDEQSTFQLERHSLVHHIFGLTGK